MGPTLIFHRDIPGRGQRSRSKVKYVTENDDISRAHRIFNICRREMGWEAKCSAGHPLKSRSKPNLATTSGFRATGRYVETRRNALSKIVKTLNICCRRLKLNM